ncbi:6-phosphogluconolactonase [Siphonobacter aquaeclarae]|uniref:6-phosphogluconolactonase n=1 Tax=Siphonobacter aquaeclarae TaxID=563176 RepID=A0A1G9RIQ9_9BACT|nr:6-phosphogluconolactonase [Siphonobacter aquaeclarae]SDM23219.1 6-phosphogluconolactonase [Siphonobacter aquaeclarae]
MTLNIFETADETLTGLAEYFLDVAQERIAETGRFSVALSGGSSPKKLYEILAQSHAGDLDWSKVFFFFGDERNVPHTDKDSNYLMAKTALFDPLNIDPAHVFPVPTELGPEKAAAAYTETIAAFFGGGPQVFDLVLLGLGDNSHTASLFPHTTILTDTSVGVKEVFLPEENVYRISLTAPLINQALNIAYLVYGKGKALAVRHIIEDEEDIQQFPAQLIDPTEGDLQWFLDEDAASELSE